MFSFRAFSFSAQLNPEIIYPYWMFGASVHCNHNFKSIYRTERPIKLDLSSDSILLQTYLHLYVKVLSAFNQIFDLYLMSHITAEQIKNIRRMRNKTLLIFSVSLMSGIFYYVWHLFGIKWTKRNQFKHNEVHFESVHLQPRNYFKLEISHTRKCEWSCQWIRNSRRSHPNSVHPSEAPPLDSSVFLFHSQKLFFINDYFYLKNHSMNEVEKDVEKLKYLFLKLV